MPLYTLYTAILYIPLINQLSQGTALLVASGDRCVELTSSRSNQVLYRDTMPFNVVLGVPAKYMSKLKSLM